MLVVLIKLAKFKNSRPNM